MHKVYKRVKNTGQSNKSPYHIVVDSRLSLSCNTYGFNPNLVRGRNKDVRNASLMDLFCIHA